MEGLSDINIPIVINQEDLESYLETKLPDTIYQSDEMGGEDIRVEVRKTGKASIDVQGKKAEIILPLDIKAERSLGFLKAKADGSLFLGIRTTVSIKEDWEIDFDSEIMTIDWVNEPKLKLAGLNFSVKGMVERMLQGDNSPIMAQLDEQLRSGQPLKKFLDDFMPNFERAYALDPHGESYIQIIPKTAGLSPFLKDDYNFTTNVHLGGRTVLLKDSAEVDPDLTKPTFKWLGDDMTDYQLTVHIRLTDEEIEAAVRDAAIGQAFRFRGKEVTIDQIFFDLQGGKIKVDVHTSGGIKGMVHFEGRPTWDDGKGELEFCDQNIEMDIKYGISKFLIWLAGPSLKKAMAVRIEKELNKAIEERVEEVNRFMSNFQPAERSTLQAEIFDWSVDPLNVRGKTLELGINLKARGVFTYDGLKFQIQ